MRWSKTTIVAVLITACIDVNIAADSALPRLTIKVDSSWYNAPKESDVDDNTILDVPRGKDKKGPDWWVRPWWASTVDLYIAKWDDVTLVKPRCAGIPECSIAPETLRAETEKQLQAMPDWGSDKKLSLDVYSLARNIESEFGDGTAEERASIVFCAINRYQIENFKTVTEGLVHHTKGTYGQQLAQIYRPSSTRQAPRIANLFIADFLYDGYVRGVITDITNGAHAYLDKPSQDASHDNAVALGITLLCKDRAAGDTSPCVPETGVEVLADWSKGGDYVTWVGWVPNVRVWRLCLVKFRRDLKPAEGETAEIKKANAAKWATKAAIDSRAIKALGNRENVPFPRKSLIDPISMVMLGDPDWQAADAKPKMDMTALAITGFAVVTGLAISVAVASGRK